ncbi:LysR family transcriptional regulator [Streptomyces sp. RS10V-4]|uniref:LysR family transcriptional regulator n=1 Tax=Streptomyces rhizoryzae TaxID=2932493 RepID=UPI00200381B6|nr:LysR family transcriptional regulator [Streptomyces rhizoryzae]MCK7626476.1 LysR family transcriptional regulator [Streptomyces rhizoryzae]
MEIRELRYFVAVAEERHFGRATARPAIAQPALSKTIQRIESRLRVRLLDRTSRSVASTHAGAALLEHRRHALNDITLAVQHAQRAADDAPLRLVTKPGKRCKPAPGNPRHLHPAPPGPAGRHPLQRHRRPHRPPAQRTHQRSPALHPLQQPHRTHRPNPPRQGPRRRPPENHRLATHDTLCLNDLKGETSPDDQAFPATETPPNRSCR